MHIPATLVLTLGLVACGTATQETAPPEAAAAGTPQPAPEGIADTDLGLSKTSVFDTPAPTPAHLKGGAPGSNEPLPRVTPEAPPLIPHSLDGLVPITLDSNACLGCHHAPDRIGQAPAKGVPTAIPESHYTDWRAGTPPDTSQIEGARYACTMCHVPQTDAPLLVENSAE